MLRFTRRELLISEYIENVRADRLDGDKFNKRLNKGKTAECEIVDIVKKVSVHTGETFGTEYWAISLSEKYTTSGMFEVSKASILRSRLNGL